MAPSPSAICFLDCRLRLIRCLSRPSLCRPQSPQQRAECLPRSAWGHSSLPRCYSVSTPSLAAPDLSTTRSQPASVTTPLPPRLSYWDILGRVQRLEDTSFTKEDAREMEAARKKEREEDKEEAKQLKKDMQKMAELTQTNFMITSFLTVLSLFFSLAANEGFTAKVFPPQ